MAPSQRTLRPVTWRLAQHTRELVAGVERDGGMFLMADADIEVRTLDALYRLTAYLPFGDANVSWMRRLLADGRTKSSTLHGTAARRGTLAALL